MKIENEPALGKRGPAIDEGVWIIVFGDLLMFSLFFGTYLYYRSLAVEIYDASQMQLNLAAGLLNTIVLLTSSWFVVLAVQAERRGAIAPARRLIASAALMGGVFVVVKVFEYAEKTGDNVSIATSEFFMFYFMLTGIHLVHVIVGTIVLIIVRLKAIGRTSDERSRKLLEGGAVFWHMVDIVWVVLFPLLYLVR